MRGHRATPRGMSSDRPSRGRLTSDSTVLKDGETSLRPSWGRPRLLFSVLRRPCSVNDSLRLSHPLRLDGAHEAMRVGFALPSQNCALMLAYFNAASSRTCLRRPRWAIRDASSLHKRENDNLRCRRLDTRNGGKKRGLSASAHGPIVARSVLAENPISRAKLAA